MYFRCFGYSLFFRGEFLGLNETLKNTMLNNIHQPKQANHLSKLPLAESGPIFTGNAGSLKAPGDIKELFLKILKVMF
jgi:hypothetical protein